MISLHAKQFLDAGLPVSKLPVYAKKLLTRDPLAVVTRDADLEWSDMVNSVMDILYIAEGLGLTQQGALDALATGDTPLALEGLDPVLVNRTLYAVSVGGNFGEIYKQSLQASLPRESLNSLNVLDNNKTKGLLYSFPLGGTNQIEATVDPGAKLSELLDRGTHGAPLFLTAPSLSK
ncbi:hypothetical protein ACA910_014943 [Epithemia clementina (nom. ined.)]